MICRKATVALPMPIFSLPTTTPLLPEHKIGVFVLFWLPKPPFSGVFEHKIEVFVRFCPLEPLFWGISSTKSGFLCSGRVIAERA